MDIQKTLGKNVRRYREEKGWSQEDLAELSGLHRTYISGIERGVRNPTTTVVLELALALQVQPSDLFKERVNE